MGNRVSQLIDGVATTLGYDDNDKLLYINDILSAGYDGNGNTTSTFGPAGDATFTYDDENQLTSLTYLSGTENVTDLYEYDPSGRRLRARLDGTYYRYIYNGERVLQETDDAGATVADDLTAGGSYFSPLLAIQPVGGPHRFPLYDMTGTTHALADPDGTVTDEYVPDAFGVYLSGSGSTVNPYGFGGAWGYMTDPSGTLQLGARTYLPKLGRFLQQDPSGDGMNWYVYAESNPVVRVDPEGLYFAGTHAQDTFNAARSLGFSGPAACAMAKGARDADHGASRLRRAPHNFGRSGSAKRYAAAQLKKAVRLWKRGKRQEAYRELGSGAHAIQDSYAHGGIGFLEHLWLGMDPKRHPDVPCNAPYRYEQSKKGLAAYLGDFSNQINAP